MKPNHSAALGLVSAALLAQTGCHQANVSAPEPKKPKLVFITSGADSFWQLAMAGIEAAARDFQAEFELLSARGDADGVAYPPTNATVHLMTAHGQSCVLGVDHYKAGRKAGTLAKELLPPDGKIFIFAAHPESPESAERRRGIVDELADTANFVFVPGQASIIIALSADDLSALCTADELGRTKVIAFGETESALEALAAGQVHALITHQPYQYGYHAVRVLAALARGDNSVLPRSGFLEMPLAVRRLKTSSHATARPLH